ncbi:MAG: protein kinase [Anaerolineaceae bacterium]|nr:protein kinase [Anaerolineaceae bacterium]
MADLGGKEIRGYVLRKRVGAGGFGAVYRAHQPVVDREVAIKIILPEYANHPDFIRRFEVEAQLVARLEHPYIVPLYDFWREPDSAYLVMRWLRGGNLRKALEVGTWNLKACAQMLDQIASALIVAHRQDVIHRDIKPDNILLDEQHNAYLSDFGIATELKHNQSNPKEEPLFGSPHYLPPERILREPNTPRSDIYSLGIVVYEMLTGQLPFSNPTTTEIISQQLNDPMPPLQVFRPELPETLNMVIWRATAKRPEARYQDVLSFAADFRQAVGQQQNLEATIIDMGTPRPPSQSSSQGTDPLGTGILTAALQITNPYKGLRPFEEADAPNFFGRDDLIQRLVYRLGQSERFLAVVGPSGSGKSSVVKAGLIPTLRRGLEIDSSDWFTAVMVPSQDPFEELNAVLLGVASNVSDILLKRLRQDEKGLSWAVQQVLPGDDSELVLVIDQFEELFTLVQDEAARSFFLNSLAYAVTDENSRLRVVITLRADFYDRPLLNPIFGDLMRQHTEVVLPLSPVELEQAIVGPAKRISVTLERGLVAALVAEVGEQPGSLPLLQYTLTEMFEQRDGMVLKQEAYHQIGGVSGALAQRAEELYQALDAQQQLIARRLLLRLVTLGDGTDATRRRTLWPELMAVGADRAVIQQVLDQFGKSRLLTFDRDPNTRTPTVEIAHESLIQAWVQFRDWVETSRDDLRVYRRLAVATTEWLHTNRDASYLATGARLEQFEGLTAKSDFALNADEAAYVQAGLALRVRGRNRLRLFILTLVIFSIVALALAAFAFDRQNQAIAERDRADLQSRIARSRELASTALTNLDQLDLSLLLSLEALDTVDTFEARSALLTGLENNPRIVTFMSGHEDAVRSVAFSVDGTLLASGSRDKTIRLWDVATHQAIGNPLNGHTGWVNSVAFNPDGGMLASGSADGTVRLWDVTSEAAIGDPLLGHEDAVWSVAFSPSGQLLASGSADTTIILWDVTTGTALFAPLAGHEDTVYSVAFSPDGKILASGSADATIILWDVATGMPLNEPLFGHQNWILSLVFSPDGKRLASSDIDGRIILWDTTTWDVIREIDSGHTDYIRSLSFSPDGTLLASSSDDGTIRLWDTMTGRMAESPLDGQRGTVWSVAFGHDTHTLAASGGDGTVILWDTKRAMLDERVFTGHTDAIASLSFSPDGTLLASAAGDPSGQGSDNTIRLWDAQSGSILATLEDHAAQVTSVAFSPDGVLLASSSGDGSVRVWDVATHLPALEPLLGHQDVIWQVVFSSDGKRLASASDDGTVILWDVQTGKPIGEPLIGSGAGLVTVAFSPDDRLVAAGGRDGAVMLWDMSVTPPTVQALTAHTDVVTQVVFGPDGTLLASGSRDGSVILWDIATQQSVRQPLIGGHDWVSGLDFSPDGNWLAVGYRDATVVLWDLQAGQPLGMPLTGHTDWVTSVAFGPDGLLLASAGWDARILIWDVGVESWRGQACTIANRNLSAAEWQRYFHDEPFHQTCQHLAPF